MMYFFRNLNLPSRSLRRWLASSRKSAGFSACVASMFLASLISMSGSAAGFQTAPSQPPTAQGQNRQMKVQSTNAQAQQKTLSESRIAELRAFVKTHHPEIMPLLDFLEKKRSKRFDKVMAGLDRNVSNLERLQKRSPEAYQRGLATWINQSRIKLYAAEYKVAADEETAAELRKKIRLLIEENLDARVSQLERDVASSKERAARLQKTADDIRANRDALIEKKIATATKRALKMKTGPKVDKGSRQPPQAGNKAGSVTTDKQESAAKTKSKPKN